MRWFRLVVAAVVVVTIVVGLQYFGIINDKGYYMPVTNVTPSTPITSTTSGMLNTIGTIMPILMLIFLCGIVWEIINFVANGFNYDVPWFDNANVGSSPDSPTIFRNGVLVPNPCYHPPQGATVIRISACDICGSRGQVFICYTQGVRKELCDACLYR